MVNTRRDLTVGVFENIDIVSKLDIDKILTHAEKILCIISILKGYVEGFSGIQRTYGRSRDVRIECFGFGMSRLGWMQTVNQLTENTTVNISIRNCGLVWEKSCREIIGSPSRNI